MANIKDLIVMPSMVMCPVCRDAMLYLDIWEGGSHRLMRCGSCSRVYFVELPVVAATEHLRMPVDA